MFYVEYEIAGFDGIKRAGPYPPEEAEYQRWDIAGFEGVHSVKLVPAEEQE